MHKTDPGEKRKELRKRALKLAWEAKAAGKAAGILPEASRMELQKEADQLRAETEALKLGLAGPLRLAAGEG